MKVLEHHAKYSENNSNVDRKAVILHIESTRAGCDTDRKTTNYRSTDHSFAAR